jgi:kynurenine formamidase
MCLPLCLEKMCGMSRRRFLAAGAAAIASTAGTAQVPAGNATNPEAIGHVVAPFQFNRVMDLTHTLGPDFPTGSGQQQLNLERLATWPKDSWNIYRWHVHEHTGTHLDAPLHRSKGDSADLIPAANLVGPLAVVDIRRRAAADPDAQLIQDDLKTWESKHGRLPAGGIVAMCSGWDEYVRTSKFRNAGGDGAVHTPGFHIDAVEFLLAERGIKGLVVDTLSLDRGLSTDFPVHVRWLGSNRWGLECAANLGDLPPKGATLVVGGPKIAGASGGPSRVFALLQ